MKFKIIENNKTINSNGLSVEWDLYLPEKPKALSFVLHGFKAFRKWGFFPYVCEQLAASGIAAIPIDFSLNGIIDPEKWLLDAEKFGRNTVSNQIEDLKAINDDLSGSGFFETQDMKLFRKFALGHSLGGQTALLADLKYDIFDGFALWAVPSRLIRQSKRQIDEWQKTGRLIFFNNATSQELWLNFSFAEDLIELDKKYSMPQSVSKIEKPGVVVHGVADLTVRLTEAKQLIAKSNSNFILRILEKTGHTFGAVYPFEKPAAQLENAIEITTNFFLSQ